MHLSKRLKSSIVDRLRGSSLRARSSRGVMALGAGTVVERGTRFVRYMILARLLAPGEIGRIAVVMSLSVAFEALTEVGVKQSVIQNKRGADPDYLNVAWWMQAMRGLGLFVLAFLAAPWVSSFYEGLDLLLLLRVSFIAIVFRGFVSPRAHVLQKEYKFGRVVLLIQGSALMGTITTIILAFMIRNVWALVAGFVAEAFILCLLSYILVPFLPRLRIDRGCLAELMKFARGMFGLPILTMISFQTDVLVLGKMVSGDQVGLYTWAAALAYLPIDLFSRIIYPVLLPTFSQKQDDSDALCRGVLEVSRWTAVFCLPLIALMVCCTGPILLSAYSPEYVAAAIPFGILCLHIIARTEGAVLGTVYMAVGLPHLHRRFVTLRAVIIAGFIYPAVVHFGPTGAAAVIVLGNFAALLMQVFWCRRVIDLKLGRYMLSYIPGLLLALPVIAAVGLLRAFGIDSAVLILIAGAFALLAAYAAYFGTIFVSRGHEDSLVTWKETGGTLAGTALGRVEDA